MCLQQTLKYGMTTPALQTRKLSPREAPLASSPREASSLTVGKKELPPFLHRISCLKNQSLDARTVTNFLR